MKKLLYLFIASAMLLSCESEDETSMNSDPIIGKWQLTSTTENGTETSSDCERKSTVTFSSDGSFTYFSSYDDGGANCSNESSSGTWKNSGNSNYTLDFSNGDSGDTKINFSNSNKVFSTTDTDDFNGTTTIYIETYKKI